MKIILFILIFTFNYNLHSNELIDLIGFDKYYKTQSYLLYLLFHKNMSYN